MYAKRTEDGLRAFYGIMCVVATRRGGYQPPQTRIPEVHIMNRCFFRFQFLSLALLIISVSAMGAEIFINDMENITAMKIWAVIAIVCLNVNALGCIGKLWKNGTKSEKRIAVFLVVLIAVFWLYKLI